MYVRMHNELATKLGSQINTIVCLQFSSTKQTRIDDFFNCSCISNTKPLYNSHPRITAIMLFPNGGRYRGVPLYTFSIGRHFFPGHPYIGSTTVLPDYYYYYSSRLQIAPSILITFHIKKDTRHVRLEFQGTATVSYSTRHRNSTNDSK